MILSRRFLIETGEDINHYVPTVISHVKKRFLWMRITYTKQLSKKIAKGMVDKLIADKMIKIESNYDIMTDSTTYRGYLDVVLPENHDEKGRYI